jgi:D-alanine-D-alanine ligase
MKVGLVFGGRSVEHQVSVRSARTVGKALEEAGHEVIPIAPTVRVLLDADVDIVFPLVHGTWGEDGSLQGLCEMADLAYVGADVTASAVAMDKLLTKRLLEAV